MPRQYADASAGVDRFFQFSLLGLVSSGFLAVAASGYLDAITIAVTAAALLFRGLLICGLVHWRLSVRATNIATLAYIGFFALDYFLLSRQVLGSLVHLLFFLAVMKVMTADGNRDYLYTAVISFLELLAAAILSIDFNFFLILALYMLCAIAALTSGEIRRSLLNCGVSVRPRSARVYPRLAALSALATVGILILTSGLFFILPRTAEAAFSRLIAQRIFLPGFSNQVTLGQTGQIQTSSRPVMHIRIWGALPVGPLKWRGAVLTEFDGIRWTLSNGTPERIEIGHHHVTLAPSGLRPPGRGIIFHVDLEPTEYDALFFAGTPEALDLPAEVLYLSDSSVVRLGHPLSRGFHYDAWSLLDPPPETASPLYPPPVLPLQQRQRYLQLPALDPRIPALARDFAGDAPSDMARARAIERHLRRDYTYTLDLPDRKTSDPLADFLFTRKRGYCEYFASALAVMLRSQGIPARLATGFQSGVFNPVSGLWLVRASDAHSWVEAWIPGHGWCIFDPTPPDLNPGGLTLLTRLALYLDAADTFWREWVVTYDLTRQGTLAFRLEQQLRLMGSHWTDGLRSWRSAPAWRSGAWLPAPWLKTPGRLGGIAFAWLAGMAAIGFGARHAMRWLVLRRRLKRLNRGHASVADATLLYHRMLDLLGKRGYQKPPWLTPAEFARGLPATPLGAAVGEFTAAYNALRFGGQAAAARKLSTLLERLDRA